MSRKIVIIGQSVAAFSAIKTLRAQSTDLNITLIPVDGQYLYDRSKLLKLIGREIKEKDVFCAPESFYKDNRIEVLLGKEISRINVSRRKVYLADRIQIDYDELLLTDAPQVRFPEMSGIRRQGVFHLARLDAARKLVKHLMFVETAVVVVSSPRGVEIAEALKNSGKEVVIVSPVERDIPGIRVVVNNPLEDVLGEGEVQAVRFKSGKIMACEAVIFDDVQPDLRFLPEQDVLMQQRICVHTNMRSSVDSVYAADAMMELASPSFVGTYSMAADDAERQGIMAAEAILGVHSRADEVRKGHAVIAAVIIFAALIFQAPVFAQSDESLALDSRKQGLICQSRGEYGKAVYYYQQALVFKPGVASLYNDIGLMQEYLGHPKEAETNYLKAVELNEAYLPAYTNLGMFYLNVGQYAQAARYLRERVARGSPEDPWTKKTAAELEALYRQVPGLDARRVRKEADDFSARILQARDNLRRKELRNRMIDFESAYSQGIEAFERRRYDEAVQMFKAASSLDPQNSAVRLALKRAQYASDMSFVQQRAGVLGLDMRKQAVGATLDKLSSH
jgi:Flp pilus assembly protein TadD